jgi:hypothetical protein
MSHTIIKLKSNNTFVLNDQKVESLYIDSKNETIRIVMISGGTYMLGVNIVSGYAISSETYHDLVDYWIGD